MSSGPSHNFEPTEKNRLGSNSHGSDERPEAPTQMDLTRHARKYAHPLNHKHTQSYRHARTHTLIYTVTQARTHTHAQSHSDTRTHTHARAPSLKKSSSPAAAAVSLYCERLT